jgi:hypothetical protein
VHQCSRIGVGAVGDDGGEVTTTSAQPEPHSQSKKHQESTVTTYHCTYDMTHCHQACCQKSDAKSEGMAVLDGLEKKSDGVTKKGAARSRPKRRRTGVVGVWSR